jgi:hypothetical protein
MKKSPQLIIILVLIISGLLTFMKIPLASSQGLSVNAAFVEEELPVNDPHAELWRRATAVEVPLSAQNIARPISLETRTRSVTVRSLQNERQLAILVEWADETMDESAVRVQDFKDMVAVQFPLSEGQPFFCMGQTGGNVNIWTWKADWQADMLAHQDIETEYPHMYVEQYPFTDLEAGLVPGPQDYTDENYLPALEAGNLFASPDRSTPVENLVAGGYGSLTTLPLERQIVQGYGEWEDGRWRVIFSRDLVPLGEGEVAFAPGRTYSVAFAAWDGAHQERNGQKSTSQWVSLQLRSAAAAPGAAAAVAPELPWWRSAETVGPILVIALVVFFAIGAFIYFRLPE